MNVRTLAPLLFLGIVAADIKTMGDEPPAAYASVPQQVSGESLKAFQTAFESLLRREDFAPYEKRLENYRVSFSETVTEIEVTFTAKRDADEAGRHSGRSKLGQDIRFRVSKTNYAVVEVSFFR